MARFVLYADDTNLFLSHKNPAELYNIAKSELTKVFAWFNINRLSINSKKSLFIFFHNNRSTLKNFPNQIKIDGTTILRTNSCKFLGVQIHENLSWSHHVKEISSKISKQIGIISRIRHKLSVSHLIMLYNAFILPYLTYCVTIWGNSPAVVLNTLTILQKKVIRLITNSAFLAHTAPLFSKLNLLNVNQLNF